MSDEAVNLLRAMRVTGTASPDIERPHRITCASGSYPRGTLWELIENGYAEWTGNAYVPVRNR